MTRLLRISGKDIIKKLGRAGYVRDHQTGSHVWLKHSSLPSTSVPLHDIIGPGLLRQILREIGMSPEEFSQF